MNVILRLCIALCVLYVAVLALLYFFQERLIFFPSKLEPNHEFSFDQPFEEIRLDANGTWISGLKFLAQSRDGGQIYSDANGKRKAKNGAVIFFHGNAGNLQGWGKYAQHFTDLGYDFYLFDYRGYGKSGGKISSQEQLYADADLMMEPVLREYYAGEIAVIGYSVGSGLAARTAQKYGAKRLVLIAPYFSLEDLAREKMPFVPKFLIKYKIPTFEFVGDFGGPVTIFHGEHDELIGVDNSRRLLKFLKLGDKIYELNAGHNDILALGELWGKLGEKLCE
ncbi:alpha/beta hydrolase [Campylobacter showae]|uniref:Bem46 protein n=1 Tax=Campylobacter showae CSUNSWCD TaxID=1244083 RepID=M5ITB1_9BACT|nr:alpha/beta fold hydrolase [Campylobacter showae]EKU12508.1 Bem46 protein [Campylobacter showae CSUNSWCD]